MTPYGSRCGSTLAQVMACCLMAPSHYLNQYWQIISEVMWHSSQSIFTGNVQDIYPWQEFENYKLNIQSHAPGINESKHSPLWKWKKCCQWYFKCMSLNEKYILNKISTGVLLTINQHWFKQWIGHDDIITWKYFLHCWTFVRGIHQSLVDSCLKGPVTHASMFSLMLAKAKT